MPEPLPARGDCRPFFDVRERIPFESKPRTGVDELSLIREVRVISVALDSGTLGDLRDRGACRSKGPVQLHGSFSDPAPRLSLGAGAPAQPVGTLFARITSRIGN